jgi:hypothetical protein
MYKVAHPAPAVALLGRWSARPVEIRIITSKPMLVPYAGD